MTHIRCPWHADFTCNVIVTLPAIGSYQPRFYSSLDIATRYQPGQVDLVTVPWAPEHMYCGCTGYVACSVGSYWCTPETVVIPGIEVMHQK